MNCIRATICQCNLEMPLTLQVHSAHHLRIETILTSRPRKQVMSLRSVRGQWLVPLTSLTTLTISAYFVLISAVPPSKFSAGGSLVQPDSPGMHRDSCRLVVSHRIEMGRLSVTLRKASVTRKHSDFCWAAAARRRLLLLFRRRRCKVHAMRCSMRPWGVC